MSDLLNFSQDVFSSVSSLENVRIGLCICGSFCTLANVFDLMIRLRETGAKIIPIMSFNAFNISTRFGSAKDNINVVERISGNKVIATIEDAEPIGPKNLTDIMLVANCTGNTLAKLAMSITDTPVTMAVKSHLRGSKPVVLSVATNDALAGSLKNIAYLMNYKNYFFVPMKQDDSTKKPFSLMSDFSFCENAIVSALNKIQLQPIFLTNA